MNILSSASYLSPYKLVEELVQSHPMYLKSERLMVVPGEVSLHRDPLISNWVNRVCMAKYPMVGVGHDLSSGRGRYRFEPSPRAVVAPPHSLDRTSKGQGRPLT